MQENQITSQVENVESPPLSQEEQKARFQEKLDQADKSFVQKVELDKLENNTILVFKICEDNLNLIMALPLLAKKYEDVLKSKNAAMLIINPEESVEALDEKQMKTIGWVKENPSLIITPDRF